MLRYKVTALSNDTARLIEREAMFSHLSDALDCYAEWLADSPVIMLDTETNETLSDEPRIAA
jgi:hypothetical protein